MIFLNRTGGFFILVSLVCMAVFFFSEPSGSGRTNLDVLVVGVLLMASGIWLKVKNRPALLEGTRFKTLRRLGQKRRAQRQARLAKQKAKEKQRQG